MLPSIDEVKYAKAIEALVRQIELTISVTYP